MSRPLSRIRSMPALVAGVLCAGCASGGVAPAGSAASAAEADPPATCEALAAAWDAATLEHGVADAQAARIDGFAFLRVDRVHAAQRGADEASRRDWVEALAALDRRARGHELANLPGPARAALGASAAERADGCRAEQVERVLASAAASETLESAVHVPDSYQPAARVLGLYPLTSMPFLGGVERLHADFAEVFATPLEALPVAGRLERLGPPPTTDEPIAHASAAPDPATLRYLVARHAPLFEVDVATDDDRIGQPVWTTAGVRVDTSRPVVFAKSSRVLLEGRWLLQLAYVAWFPARPPASGTDLLAGNVDGITWRVTLDDDGEPLLYDAMHNCGCYHMFFPTTALRRAPDRSRYEEPPFVAQTLERRSGRIVIRVAHRTHYIERVYHAGEGSAAGGSVDTRYALADYDTLRSLEAPGGGRRSLFGPDGLVPGTERGERYLFWPMGVRSPGAMRQWGHHATAFVGRRHFDDPDLLERYFERAR